MKRIFSIILLLIFTQCSNLNKTKVDTYSSSMNEDIKLLGNILEQFAGEKGTPSGELMVKIGNHFLGTPYIANTLEIEGHERLIINLREMDCTTFTENCLALVKTIKSNKPGTSQFIGELTKIRYRNSKIKGYPSRLHYTTDWIFDNQQKNLLQNVTKEIAEIPYIKTIDFMSSHPDSYRHLKNNRNYVEEIAIIEKEITHRQHYFIPKEKVFVLEDYLKDGDIVGLTTNIEGLDVSHMGILTRYNNRIHMLHASLAAKKVILSEETLEEYLNNRKSLTGIIVARPL